MTDELESLRTESINPASANLDELTALEIVRLMNAEDRKVPPAVATQEGAIARAIEAIAERLRQGGRLIYVGAGTSGRLGVLDATECPPTFQSPPEQVVGVIAGGLPALTRAVERAEDDPALAVADLRQISVTPRDVVVGIATSGRTPYVLGAVNHAKAIGALTVGISCNPGSELERDVDLAITPVVGPEVLTGSTRLKAGSATKMVLNMLSTGTMVLLGKTYGHLMVDVKASNSKLRARARSIVRELTQLSADAASELLSRCDGEVKTAVVSHLASISPEDARLRLCEAGGRVQSALEVRGRRRCSVDLTADDLVLGVDGGGSHTVALLAERGTGKILGRGRAGPSNLNPIGLGRAAEAIASAVAAAFRNASLPHVPVHTVCLGLAGAGHAEGEHALRQWAERNRLGRQLLVTSDVSLLLAAGSPEGWGLAVVAGTGSIAIGKTPDGRTARAGGWGSLLGDEGGAYRIVVESLRAVFRSADRLEENTLLTERFLQHFGIQCLHDVIPVIYRGESDRAALASLAPLVLQSAEAGDAIALQVVSGQARELARATRAVVDRLGLPRQDLPLALAGGVFLGCENYRTWFVEALEAGGLRVAPPVLVTEPAEGAIRLARAGKVATLPALGTA